jgi:DNA mismatch repair protein MutL
MHGTYLICQNETGLYLIDQHAAKERINYEYYKENIGISNKRTSMLIPLTLEFSNMESLVLKENLSFLEELGFAIQEFGINTFIVKEHPIWLKKNEETETIKTILDLIILKEKNFDKQKFNDHVAATVACKASIKANENITNEEAIYLIEDLKKCQNPYNCPHGRPTIINFTKEEIEKLFKRTGF